MICFRLSKNISLFKSGTFVFLAVLCSLTSSLIAAAPQSVPDAKALNLLKGAITASEKASPLIADLTVRGKGSNIFGHEYTVSVRLVRQNGGATHFLSSSPKPSKQEKDWVNHLSGEDVDYNPFLSHIPSYSNDPTLSLTYVGKEKKDGTQYDVVEMGQQVENRALGEVHQSVTKWYIGSDSLVHRISSSQVTLYPHVHTLEGSYYEVKSETILRSLYANAPAEDLASVK